MNNILTYLKTLKSEVDKLDVDKLVPVPADASKLGGIVMLGLNAKIDEVKGEIPNVTNLATTSSLSSVENKIPNLVKKK